MAKLAESVEKYEYEWRRYEQESGEVLPEHVKGVVLLKMFPPHHYADELRLRYNQGGASYQQIVDSIMSYGHYLRTENAFKRGDTDAMIVDAVDFANDQGLDNVEQKGTKYTAEEESMFYKGYEDGLADGESTSVDPSALDRPLAAM